MHQKTHEVCSPHQSFDNRTSRNSGPCKSFEKNTIAQESFGPHQRQSFKKKNYQKLWFS